MQSDSLSSCIYITMHGVTSSLFTAYFPFMWKEEGLRNHYTVCICCVPLSTLEPADQFSQNMIQISCHWRATLILLNDLQSEIITLQTKTEEEATQA